MSSPYNSKMFASTGDMDLSISPKSPKKPGIVGRGETYSGRNSSGNLAGKFDYSKNISPKRRNSAGTLHTSVAERRKSRTSYLNKRKGREGAANRKDLISKSMFSKVDSVFGEEENDISSKNENSYLKRLLLAPSSEGGKAPKKLNVDNCRLQRKKKPPKMKLAVPQIDRSKPTTSGTTTSPIRTSINKPKLVSPTAARTPEKTVKNKIGGSSSSAAKRLQSKAEQNAKRLSADSTDTAPTEGSDSTDNDTLLVNSTAALSIDTTTRPAIDYSDVFYSFETVSVEVNFEAPSVERSRKVSFAPKAQVASIADLIIESADASKEFQWEDLFYTEEELSDQRHEAFLEMCGLDDEF